MSTREAGPLGYVPLGGFCALLLDTFLMVYCKNNLQSNRGVHIDRLLKGPELVDKQIELTPLVEPC